MNAAAENATDAARSPARLGIGLLAAAVACLAGAGGLLWWSRGEAVFNDVVLAALAWCF